MSNNPFGSAAYPSDAVFAPDLIPKKRKTGVTLIAVMLLLFGLTGIMQALSSGAMAGLQLAGVNLQPSSNNVNPDMQAFQERMEEMGKVGPVQVVFLILALLESAAMTYCGFLLINNRRSGVGISRVTIAAWLTIDLLAMLVGFAILIPLMNEPLPDTGRNAEAIKQFVMIMFGFMIVMMILWMIIKLALGIASFIYLGKDEVQESMV